MRRDDPKVEMLKSVPRLNAMRDRDLAELAKLVEVVDLPAGTVLTEQGHLGYETLILVEGRAAVTIDDRVVNELGPGEFVGEMAQLDHGVRTATVTALTPVTALVIGPRVFPTLAATAPVALAMLDGIVGRMRQAQAGASAEV
jgi:cAMP-dependent protein kinase regulator